MKKQAAEFLAFEMFVSSYSLVNSTGFHMWNNYLENGPREGYQGTSPCNSYD